MRAVSLAVFGWLVPGGAYLLQRRYVQFAGFALLVCAAAGGGLVLRGGYQWPQPAELSGLDAFTSLCFQVGAFAKVLAGGPFLLAQVIGGSSTFLDGRLHEFGTALLVLAGLFNLLAVSDALESRNGEAR